MCPRSKLKNIFSLNSHDIATIAIYGSILLVAQIALAGIPNVEVVSLLILLYSIHFQHKTIYIIYTFVFIEGLIFGFSLWWISYTYIWLILYIIVTVFHDLKSPLLWALVLATYGFLFGTLTSIPYLFIAGPAVMVSYIASGIVFDLIHCVSNFIIVLILFKPLNKLFISI